MNYTLFLTFDGVKQGVIGPYVDCPELDDRVQYYVFENDWDYVDLFYDDINKIDKRCDALLDYGKVEWFNVVQCAKLLDWIDERFQKPIELRYKELLEVL